MARPAGKRAFKQSTAKSATAATSTKIPTPFKPVSIDLQPFASTLLKGHFYLVHIDRTSVKAKQQAFLVPVVVNVVIILGLCLRLYYAAPKYLGLVITVFNYDTSYTIDPAVAKSKDIMSMVMRRTALMLTDYSLFWLLGSWPREFILGNISNRFVGPLKWKMNIGFQDEEVIVRRSRDWDKAVLSDNEQHIWGPNEELTIKMKVDPAMRKSYTSKTGLSMLDRAWDLDYCAMSDAHRMAADGRAKLEDLEHVVLVYYLKQWLVWRVHEGHNIPTSGTEVDPKVSKFKEALSVVGCEDVFYRWIELIQYETSLPGGLSEGRKGDAMRELRQLITEKGVDYGQFWEDIGGQKNIPGLE